MAEGGELLGGIYVEVGMSFAGFDAGEQKLRARAEQLEKDLRIDVGTSAGGPSSYPGRASQSGSGTFETPWQVVGQNPNGGRFFTNPTNVIGGPAEAPPSPWERTTFEPLTGPLSPIGPPVSSPAAPPVIAASPSSWAPITNLPASSGAARDPFYAITQAASAADVTHLADFAPAAPSPTPGTILPIEGAADVGQSPAPILSPPLPQIVAPAPVPALATLAPSPVPSSPPHVPAPTYTPPVAPQMVAAAATAAQQVVRQAGPTLAAAAPGSQGAVPGNQQLIAALNNLTAAVQQAPARGGVAGGGGRTGGGGGTGGRGLATRNIFSARGLGPYVGGVTAAFGAIQAARIAGDFAEAGRTEHRPDLALRPFQGEGSAHDVQSDPFMRRAGQQLASNAATQKRVESVEAVPFLGTLVGAVDHVAGLSDNLKERHDEIALSMQRHQRAVETNDKIGIASEKQFGDPVRAIALEARAPIQSLTREIRDDANNGISPDPEKYRARDNLIRLTNDQMKAARAQQIAGLEQEAIGGHVAALGGFAAQATSNLDSTRAIELRQRAAREKLQGEFNVADAKSLNPQEKRIVESSYRERARGMVMEQGAERGEHERKIQDEITQAQSAGQAARLRMAHEEGQAQIAIFDEAAERRIKNADVRTRPAVREAVREERAALVARVEEQNESANQANQERASASVLRRNRRPFEGEMLQFVGQEGRRIAQAPAAQRDALRYAAEQEIQTRATEHNRDVQQRMEDLNTRREVALAEAKDQPLNARVIGDTQRAEREIRNAAPGERRQVIATNLAELREERHRMFEYHSGGDAAAGTLYYRPGDPMDLSGAAKDRKLGRQRIDKEIGHLEKEGAAAQKAVSEGRAPGTEAWNSQQVQDAVNYLRSIADKIQPYALAK